MVLNKCFRTVHTFVAGVACMIRVCVFLGHLYIEMLENYLNDLFEPKWNGTSGMLLV